MMCPAPLPRFRYGVLAALLSLAASSASAQVLAAPAHRAEVSVRSDSVQNAEGAATLAQSVFSRQSDAFRLHSHAGPPDHLAQAPLARAQGSAGRGALVGAAIGGAVALAVVGVTAAEYGWGCPGDECYITPVGTAAVLSLPLPLIGAGVGALVGSNR